MLSFKGKNKNIFMGFIIVQGKILCKLNNTASNFEQDK